MRRHNRQVEGMAGVLGRLALLSLVLVIVSGVGSRLLAMGGGAALDDVVGGNGKLFAQDILVVGNWGMGIGGVGAVVFGIFYLFAGSFHGHDHFDDDDHH